MHDRPPRDYAERVPFDDESGSFAPPEEMSAWGYAAFGAFVFLVVCGVAYLS